MTAQLAEAWPDRHDTPPSPRLSGPPFPFRLSRSRCLALARCDGAAAVVETWRAHDLWGNQWSAFSLPAVDAQHPCVGCPVLEVVQEGTR